METKTRNVTEKRLAANRAAAQKSTGPKTAEGKQRAAFNSFEHGAFASEQHILNQALERSGGDGGELDSLRQSLAGDWQPASAQQKLLVDDLAWLYWLRNRTRLALLERQARCLPAAELKRDQRRFRAHHRPPAVEHSDYYPDGCASLPASQDKIATMSQFLDELSLLITQGYWSEKTPKGHSYAPPTLLVFLYGQSPGTARGKQIKALWHSCALEVGRGYVPTDAPLKPLPDDPRVAAMLALIDEERAALVEEAELARRSQQIEIERPEDPAWPVLHPLDEIWKETVERLEKLERQINAKIRLLLRLEKRAVEAGSKPAPVPPVGETVEAGFSPASVPSQSPVVEAGFSPAPAAKRKNRGTNPKNSIAPLESTNDGPPVATPSGITGVISPAEPAPAPAGTSLSGTPAPRQNLRPACRP